MVSPQSNSSSSRRNGAGEQQEDLSQKKGSRTHP